MNDLERHVALSIRSRLENVRLVGAAVNGVCGSLGLDEVRRAHAELCVVEAVTNSLIHALENDPDAEIRVDIYIDGASLALEVSDRGRPVPVAYREPKVLELDESDPLSVQEGGRGLYLIFSLMDDVRFLERDGQNVLRMVTKLS